MDQTLTIDGGKRPPTPVGATLPGQPEQAHRIALQEAGFKPEVMPGILKGNAVRLLGLAA